ncbi:MAG TPA: hypothetical protein VLJ37_07045 [bacterium]|nr:hypothetical protein [bacterium]
MKKSLLVLVLAVGMIAGSAAAWAKGSVKIYEDKGFAGRVLSVRVGKNISDFKYGTSGFNDTCSSVTYTIPAGWTAILYTDSGYKGREYPMSGSSSVSDIGSFEDKCSSIQWVKNQ